MTRRVRLRRWQKEALERLHATAPRDFLVTATPGAGKTTFGLVAVLHFLREHPGARLVVVTPSRSLKAQWAMAAAGVGLELVSEWDGGRLPPDAHGVVVTYAQVGSRPREVAALARGGAALIDEIHHAGAERTWGDGLAVALEDALLRVALSGTPWRRDANPIPFVRYTDDVAQPDFAYGYARALEDGGVVRPVFFPRLGGSMEWVANDGAGMSATFDDALDARGSSQRLRTALAPDGGWLRAAVAQAHERLAGVRADDPRAGGIVFAMDQDHARGVAKVVHDITGRAPVLAISDEPDAHHRLARFAHSDEPWAVCVRYASEGYDAPRLRVGVYATNVVAPLFWAQAVGRVVRWRPESGPRQAAWMFIPDDARLRELALSVAEQRTHVLRRREDDPDEDERQARLREPGDQLSLFAAVHSEADGIRGDLAVADPWRVPVGAARDADDPALEIELPPPPRVVSPGDGPDGVQTVDRGVLRALNSERVTMIARLTGLGHREVNARLNKVSGILRIGEATRGQLQRRLAEADRWLTRL
ncbi:MAG TPA: DEAD/DEAH box helicase family protein [Egibacteraceae bacterium]|nr:DEAD/DEAH box helicase family protein [Egibacteraceae bacterium]